MTSKAPFRALAGVLLAALIYGEYAVSQGPVYGIYFYLRPYYYALPVPVFLYLVAVASGATFRQQWVAAYRGLQLLIVVLLTFNHSLVAPYFWYIVAGAVLMLGAEIAVRRLTSGPRWMLDKSGERQRVIARNGDAAILSTKTREQRVIEEAKLKKDRRSTLLLTGTLSAVCGWGCFLVWDYFQPVGAALVDLFLGGLGLTMAGIFVLYAVPELVYLTGYQGMPGAKVLDPPPPARPGLAQVQAQRVHGDARLASEDEAIDLLGGR